MFTLFLYSFTVLSFSMFALLMCFLIFKSREKKTYREWALDRDIVVVKPDGFKLDDPDRLYSEIEFDQRIVHCTVILNLNSFK